jgi:hypothetical protein
MPSIANWSVDRKLLLANADVGSSRAQSVLIARHSEWQRISEQSFLRLLVTWPVEGTWVCISTNVQQLQRTLRL